MIEEWRLIHDGFYEASNLGNIRRAKPGTATFVGRPVRIIGGSTGYGVVALSGYSSRRAYVHHLIAEAFLGHRPDGHVVNHKDCNKVNNRADNLEYVTRSQNSRHANASLIKHRGPTKPKPPKTGPRRGVDHWSKTNPERIARGARMPHCKLSPESVMAARARVSAGEMQKDIAKELGVSVAQMSRIIRKTRWTYL